VRLAAEFTDPDTSTEAAPVYVDPVNVTVRVTRPNGTVAYNGPATKTAQGHYRFEQVAEAEGRWYYRFEGQGTYQDAGSRSFFVRDTPFHSS